LSHESKCSSCVELEIDCTNFQSRKKRGPKNRYVQQLRAHLDGHEASSTIEQHALSLIAPPEVLQNIFDDWFNWIHPVAPILHRTLFMRQIQGDHTPDAHVSESFLLLVASICAATYSSLPRRRHFYGTVTVARCLELAERFSIWSSSQPITLERALIMYNFSVHNAQSIDSSLTFRLTGEASVCVKYLLQYKLDSMTFMDQQILKRLYWLVFAGQCTGEMHGRSLLVLHHAHEASSALFPQEISDEQLLHESVSRPNQVPDQHHSYVSGLNALSRLFLVWQSSQAITVQTMVNLHEHILRAHRVLNDLPPELSWLDSVNQTMDFGYNVQKVNLKVTQLHIRSNLLEQMNALARNQGFAMTPDAIIDERHLVVEELLDVLYTMPEEVFDANGHSIVPKIRDIGSALLDELRTGSHGRTLQASINLDKLLAKLENLDLRPLVHTSDL
jgi:hypothetical protein